MNESLSEEMNILRNELINEQMNRLKTVTNSSESLKSLELFKNSFEDFRRRLRKLKEENKTLEVKYQQMDAMCIETMTQLDGTKEYSNLLEDQIATIKSKSDRSLKHMIE